MRVRGPSGGVPQGLRASPVSLNPTVKTGIGRTFLHIKDSRQSFRKSRKAAENIASFYRLGKVISDS